jgi:hypothetical protein
MAGTVASGALFVFIRAVLFVLILLIPPFIVFLIISIDFSSFFGEIYHALSTLTIFFVREILKQTSEK